MADVKYIAEALLNRMVHRYKKDRNRNRRPHSAPQRPPSNRKASDLLHVERPHTAMTQSEDSTRARNDRTVSIPADVFQSILHWAQSEKELLLAKDLKLEAERQLSDLVKRLSDLQYGINEMTEWLLRDLPCRRNSYESASEDDRNSERLDPGVQRTLDAYNRQWRTITEQISDLNRQEMNMDAKLAGMTAHIETLRPGIYDALSMAKLAPDDGFPRSVSQLNEFVISAPVDLIDLERQEKEYREFQHRTRGPTPQADRYPPRATNDWAHSTRELARVKEYHDMEVAMLQQVENFEPNAETDVEHYEATLQEQRDIVMACRDDLCNAVERARQSGAHCKDSGSMIENKPGGYLWELYPTGEETIVGWWTENDTFIHFEPEMSSYEASPEELDELSQTNREKVSQWQQHAESVSSEVDNDEPASAGDEPSSCLDTLETVRPSDSISEVVGLPDKPWSTWRDERQLRQIDEWKVSQRQEREKMQLFVAEHKQDKGWTGGMCDEGQADL